MSTCHCVILVPTSGWHFNATIVWKSLGFWEREWGEEEEDGDGLAHHLHRHHTNDFAAGVRCKLMTHETSNWTIKQNLFLLSSWTKLMVRKRPSTNSNSIMQYFQDLGLEFFFLSWLDLPYICPKKLLWFQKSSLGCNGAYHYPANILVNGTFLDRARPRSGLQVLSDSVTAIQGRQSAPIQKTVSVIIKRVISTHSWRNKFKSVQLQEPTPKFVEQKCWSKSKGCGPQPGHH